MLEGYVKSFSQDKGFGFISTGEESYFFHVSDLPKSTPPLHKFAREPSFGSMMSLHQKACKPKS